VASILNQCLKYYRGREKKINSNIKPLIRAESHFVDVRLFVEGDAHKNQPFLLQAKEAPNMTFKHRKMMSPNNNLRRRK